MGKAGSTIRNIFVWTYARGTIPYDIICALILLFIFLTPRSCFTKKASSVGTAAGTAHGAVSTTAAAPGK